MPNPNNERNYLLRLGLYGLALNWRFWTWHRCKCYTQSDEKGIWGECCICGKRVGYVTRQELRSYAEREIDEYLRKAGI